MAINQPQQDQYPLSIEPFMPNHRHVVSSTFVDQLDHEQYALFPNVVKPSLLALRTTLTEFKDYQKVIMLDRYSLKDDKLQTLKVGDLVVVEVKYHPEYPTQGYGFVTALSGSQVEVDVQYPESLTADDGSDIDLQHFVTTRNKLSKPLEIYWEQICHRVAKGVAGVEKTRASRRYWYLKFFWMLKNKLAIPGGRILYGAGTDIDVTLFNCFVLNYVNDSRRGISRHRETAMEIMSRSGGVGTNGSTLRPVGAYVAGVHGKSSGAVSWLNDLSRLTELVQQGGCVAPYERVMTDKGLLTVKEVFDSKDSIQALTHKGFKRIVSKFDNGQKRVFRVTTEQGYSLDASEDHKFGVYDPSGAFELRSLRDLNVGDTLALLLGNTPVHEYHSLDTTPNERSVMATNVKSVTLPQVFDEKLAYLIGYYHANGCNIKFEYGYKGFSLSVPDDRPLEFDKLMQSITDLFDVEVSVGQGGGAVQNLYVHSVLIYDFLVNNGLAKGYSHNVEVPDLIYTSPKSVVSAYIGGLFAGDGSNKGGKGGLSLCTTSKSLATQYQQLLLLLGIASNTHVETSKNSNWREKYVVSVGGAYYQNRFSDILSGHTTKINDRDLSVKDTSFSFPFNTYSKFKHLPKFDRACTSNGKGTSTKAVSLLAQHLDLVSESDKDYAETLCSTVPSKIKSIEYVGLMNVYDFEVEDVHMLSFNGFYTSNSRRGAQMIGFADWHPDLVTFILCKIQNPFILDKITKDIDDPHISHVAESLLIRDVQGNPVGVHDTSFMTGANISVLISHDFMQAVQSDGLWSLRFPDLENLTPEQKAHYDAEWHNLGDVRKWEAQSLPTKVYHTFKASQLWDLINIAARYSAEPGIIFIDQCNDMSNAWYYAPLVVTNPCFAGNMRLLTTEGYRTFESLDGQQVTLINHLGQVSQGQVWKTGDKPTVLVSLDNGTQIECTEDHRFMLVDGSECMAKDLQHKYVMQYPTKDCRYGMMTDAGPRVLSVTPTGIVKPVYDFSEPETHWGVVEGIIVHNCGEQPLPADGVCNLLAINLAQFANRKSRTIDYPLLKKVLRISQRFSDNIIDHSYYFLPENERMAKGERRIGKGVMGLADLMIDLELPYGSEEMLQETDRLFEFIKVESYLASADIAAEKGSFPFYQQDPFLQSGFMQSMPAHVISEIETKGIRNVCSLTVAPTGTTGTMLGVSTGLEPYYAFSYFRSGRLGKWVEVSTDIARRYFDEHPEATQLPDYYVSSMDIPPLQHVKVQAVIQKHVDSSISKTCNAPRDFTVEQNKQLYFTAWQSGCKGVTVYVDGSRDKQVLSTQAEDNIFESDNEENTSVSSTASLVDVELSELTDDFLTDDTRTCSITFDPLGNMIKECH